MNQIITDFLQARKKFLLALDQVPQDKKTDILFDQWSLKDIVSHLNGWDKFLIGIIEDLQSNRVLQKWQKINEFNQKSVFARQGWSWNQVYQEFIDIDANLKKLLPELDDNFLNTKFWPKNSFTPLKYIKIETNHYLKTHLPEIYKNIKDIVKNNK
ncbi:MAG: ClbS/DfsB family four-helix bundle protein [Candidatus Shapirobacteria bacterium]|jgi:hypothetical protein